MNEQDDILEEELRSMRPAPPSSRVRQQIEHRLRPRIWRIVAVCGAMAALIALAATLWLRSPIERPAAAPQMADSLPLRKVTPAITPSGGEVTAWHYRQVARQSPDQLMRLLDEQAANAAAIGGPTPTVHQLLESQS